LLGAVAWRLTRVRKTPRARLFHFFCAAALGVLAVCEFISFRDGLGQGYQRLNVLFKFHYPCWVLLGLVWPVCLRSIWEQSAWPRGLRVSSSWERSVWRLSD
jgi:uncharacterized membrane protein